VFVKYFLYYREQKIVLLFPKKDLYGKLSAILPMM